MEPYKIPEFGCDQAQPIGRTLNVGARLVALLKLKSPKICGSVLNYECLRWATTLPTLQKYVSVCDKTRIRVGLVEKPGSNLRVFFDQIYLANPLRTYKNDHQ